jgi:hypothetical protein
MANAYFLLVRSLNVSSAVTGPLDEIRLWHTAQSSHKILKFELCVPFKMALNLKFMVT